MRSPAQADLVRAALLWRNFEDDAAAVRAAPQGCAVEISLFVKDDTALGQPAGRGNELVQHRVLPFAAGLRRKFVNYAARAYRVSAITGRPVDVACLIPRHQAQWGKPARPFLEVV